MHTNNGIERLTGKLWKVTMTKVMNMDVIKDVFPIAVPQEEINMASSTRHQPYQGCHSDIKDKSYQCDQVLK